MNPKLRSVILPSGPRLVVTKVHLHCKSLLLPEDWVKAVSRLLIPIRDPFRLGCLEVLGGQIFRATRIRQAINNSRNLLLVWKWNFQPLTWACASLMSQRSPLYACETSDTNCARENNNFSVPLNSLSHRVLAECHATMAHSIILSPHCQCRNISTERPQPDRCFHYW